MKLTATREDFLAPLQSVIGVVERRQTMPVLANVLLAARDGKLHITGTDLEVELVAASAVSVQQPGDITVPGRKLLDIAQILDALAGVQHGGVIAPAESIADLRQAVGREFLGERHRDLARARHRAAAPLR